MSTLPTLGITGKLDCRPLADPRWCLSHRPQFIFYSIPSSCQEKMVNLINLRSYLRVAPAAPPPNPVWEILDHMGNPGSTRCV